FVLTRPVHMVFGTDEPFEGSLESTCRDFCDRTRDYWLEWVRRLAFSIDWQDEIIRAAITLKLCNYEETGGRRAAPGPLNSGRAGIGTQLGLPILLDARRLFRRACAQPYRRDTHHGRLHLLHPERCGGPRPAGATALRRRAYRHARGADGTRAFRLWRRRTGSDRQCGGQSGPARCLWQHHHGRDAHVLRSSSTAPRRCGALSYD